MVTAIRMCDLTPQDQIFGLEQRNQKNIAALKDNRGLMVRHRVGKRKEKPRNVVAACAARWLWMELDRH